MNDAARIRPVTVHRWQPTAAMMRFSSYALLALAFFLLGFLPLWAASRQAAARQAETSHELRLAQMQNTLGSAVISAQGGDYEYAMQAVSRFYTGLQAEFDNRESSALAPAQQAALLPLLAGRDDLIALLAREDASAIARLSEMYASFSQVVVVMGPAPPGIGVSLQDKRELIPDRQLP
jgi:hypothetical protein